MLNPFPIQFLALFAYAILRFFVGSILLYLGLRHFNARHELSQTFTLSWWPYGMFSVWIFICAELLLGTLIVLGAYTQWAVLAVMLMSIKLLFIRHWFSHPSLPGRLFYALLLGASLSLFITGAGVFAFDLPI